MLELHLRARVRPGRHEDLRAFLREAIPYYEQPGGIRIRLLWDAADPNRFVEIAEYADQAAYDRDQERVATDPRMLAYVERWRALLAGPPQIETYIVAADLDSR